MRKSVTDWPFASQSKTSVQYDTGTVPDRKDRRGGSGGMSQSMAGCH